MSDVAQGDAETPVLDVAPADGSTVAVLTVNKPDGTSASLVVTGGDLVVIAGTNPVQYSQRWTAATPVVYDQPGRWVLGWDVTGAGEGAEDLEVWVAASPVAGGPTWLPGRSRVANYIPHRTLVRSSSSTIGSQDTYELTFDSTTLPTGVQVDRIIADGAAWVAARAANLHVTLHDAGSVCVALYCAAAVERAWPNDDQSLQRANDMEKRLDGMLTTLVDANEAANGTGDYGLDIASPAYTFPPADLRYDYARYW
jgi:hypothetical protein